MIKTNASDRGLVWPGLAGLAGLFPPEKVKGKSMKYYSVHNRREGERERRKRNKKN